MWFLNIYCQKTITAVEITHSVIPAEIKTERRKTGILSTAVSNWRRKAGQMRWRWSKKFRRNFLKSVSLSCAKSIMVIVLITQGCYSELKIHYKGVPAKF